MELNQIVQGNAYELIKQVPDKSIDLIITDPPYEITGLHSKKNGFFKWKGSSTKYLNQLVSTNLGVGINLEILPELVRVMKKINIYLWCNKEQIYDYMTFFVKERKCNFEIIVWAKTNPAPFVGGHYLKDKEYCLYFWERGVKLSGTYETMKTFYTTSTNVEDKELYNHPTIKPLPIIENLIKNSSGGGEIIFDPFVGSGTTCAGAKELGQQYLGFEIDPNYYQIAVNRLNGITQKEKKENLVQEKLF